MTLGFKTEINGKPNYFIEKIWQGLIEKELINPDYFESRKEHSQYQFDFFERFGFHWNGQCRNDAPKLHTIREDKHNRWEPGMDIHMVVNNRAPNRFQFAPVIKCVSIQDIQILNCNHLPMNLTNQEVGYLETLTVNLNGKGVDFHNYWKVWIGDPNNGRFLTLNQIEKLAINDGFDSVEDFFAFFNKDFTGKIIHWTNLKY